MIQTPDSNGLGQVVDSITAAPSILAQALQDLPVSTSAVRSVVLSLVVILVAVAVRRIIIRVVEANIDEPSIRYRWAKATSYVSSGLALLFIVAIWLEGIRELGTFFGLVSAGLAIALKDPVVDFAGWIFILWRRPFHAGDRIQIGSFAGDVVDIRMFQFTILEIGNWVAADQSTGRVVHIPNAQVFTESLANYTRDFPYLWHEIPVLLTFESDWRKARGILEEVAREADGGLSEEARRAMHKASRRLLISYKNLTPMVYTSVKDSGVLLTIRYLCRPRERRGTSERIWEAILDRFHEEDSIDFAYPTQRMYFNPLEGKADARAPFSLPGSDGASRNPGES